MCRGECEREEVDWGLDEEGGGRVYTLFLKQSGDACWVDGEPVLAIEIHHGNYFLSLSS